MILIKNRSKLDRNHDRRLDIIVDIEIVSNRCPNLESEFQLKRTNQFGMANCLSLISNNFRYQSFDGSIFEFALSSGSQPFGIRKKIIASKMKFSATGTAPIKSHVAT